MAHSIVGLLLACAATTTVHAQTWGNADPNQGVEESRATNAAQETRDSWGNQGGSLVAPDAPASPNAVFNAPDGFVDAVPTQYPWYEMDPPAETQQAAPPPLPAAPADDWKTFGNGPRLSSIRAEYTIILPDSNHFGSTMIDLSCPVEVQPESAIFITPHFNWVWLTDPHGGDIPNHLYSLSLRTEFWLKRGDDWLFQFFIEPGMYTDFENTSSDALRLPGQALAFYQYSPSWQIAAGVIYVDREDVTILPAGGLIYKPNDRVRLDLIFPRPKLACQYGYDPDCQNWFYFLGEFGGSSWAVDRPGGDDVMTYRDVRIMFGMEQKRIDSFSWWFEAGIASGREVEFRSGVGDFEANASLLGRVAIKF